MHLSILLPFAASGTPQLAAQRVATSWPWYVIRGAGFTAAGLLVLIMLSGIMQVTGLMYRFFEPITAWAIHKALAIALCVSIAIHAGFLLVDHFVPFSLLQLLIPFDSHYNNGTRLWGLAFGSLAVSFGVLAMYGVAILVASSLGWIDTKKHTWRLLHYISYKVWIVLGLIIVLGIISRLWRAGTMRRSKIMTSVTTNKEQLIRLPSKNAGQPPEDQ